MAVNRHVTEEEVIKIDQFVETELDFKLPNLSSQKVPKAILLGGQPGAGKTVISTLFEHEFRGDSYFINGDDFRRIHPNYEDFRKNHNIDLIHETSAFSGTLVECLISEFSKRNINLIIEGTLRTTDVPITTATQLISKGYDVALAVICTRPEFSLLSTLMRYYQMNDGGTVPRATTIDTHDNVVAVLPNNLDQLLHTGLFSQISIWNRNKDLLYDSTQDERLPSEVLLGNWNAPWSSDELISAMGIIGDLKLKEKGSHLGQSSIIHAVEQRINNVVRRS